MQSVAPKHPSLEGPGNVNYAWVERMNREHKETVTCPFHCHLGKGEHVSPSAGTGKGRAFLNCEGPRFMRISQRVRICSYIFLWDFLWVPLSLFQLQNKFFPPPSDGAVLFFVSRKMEKHKVHQSWSSGSVVLRTDWLPWGQNFSSVGGQPAQVGLLCSRRQSSRVNSFSVTRGTVDNLGWTIREL